eukprot:SAG11_NODE_2928_length_2831_cov_24.172767_1_plen_58_part_00
MELTKEMLLQYFGAFMKDELPRLTPLSEDVPTEENKYLEKTKMLKVVGRTFNEMGNA